MSLTPRQEAIKLLLVTLHTQNDLLKTGLSLIQANEVLIDTMLLHCPISQQTQDFLTPPTGGPHGPTR